MDLLDNFRSKMGKMLEQKFTDPFQRDAVAQVKDRFPSAPISAPISAPKGFNEIEFF